MYVSQLEISNYRNFKDFTVKLKPVTQIIGENNIGKSNLLDSLGLIFSQEVSFFKKRMLDVSDFNYETILKLKKEIFDTSIEPKDISYPKIVIKATLKDWGLKQEAVITDWMSNSEFTEATLTYTFAPISSFDTIEEITKQRQFLQDYQNELGSEEFNKIPESEILNLINFPISKYHYRIHGGNQNESVANAYHLNQLKFELLDALRDAKSELSASRNNGLLFRVLNANEETDYQDLKKQLVGLQRAIEGNVAISGIKTRISEQLDKISLSSETSNNVVDLIFSLPNVSDLLRKLSLIYNDNPIKIERNGTGRNNLLFISLMLSFIEDPERMQSTFFRIVGLEEPEAHLHANLQNHLASNLEGLIKKEDGTYRKDIQLILTSHSNHITTKIDFENTVVLHYKNGIIQPHYILEGFGTTAEEKRQVNYLKKYLDSENVNLFYSRRLALVEGISEKLLFPIFYKIQTGETIDQSACAVVNVNGLAFKNFIQIIVNGFHTRCLALTDSDIGTQTELRAQELKDKYDAVDEVDVQISELSTFEKDLIDCNKSGSGKNILCKVIRLVRPKAGKKYADELGTDDIDIEGYFSLIEDYKSEFALQLLLSLAENHSGFTIPKYIKDGIKFLDPLM
ncbi:ATP-dependent nuclease [Christiangramia sp. SM2212]|uniref:AAA family ATPase n=1 Tax=Christiangramia sediminicola TaxID=3073267 RepID=A0ABU1ETC4_9FLAO|nr:AAA family ATPase [Christiangramia sp. SM2212]MDR5591646.1 AAA family ATPase [Christiangramia sp. SM2212]